MSIAIGSDHAGFQLKQQIIDFLKQENLEYKDYGCYSPERVDYPDIGVKVGQAVAAGECERGILVCGSGIGISIAANKVKYVRAALCTSEYLAEMARRHNDANILALGGRTTTIELAARIIDIFLATEFEGERHGHRVDKIESII
ncbi:MAG: ribose 5-phosphate isomerase B [candidate division KSB1 bacterium]|nr:ribose 5-phosphate isomerase B [candidate division KSB1 bacterium]